MTAAPDQSAFIGKGVPPPAPADFRETFIRIGRLACEEHYRAARTIINAWMRECGKQPLIDERHKVVKAAEVERNQRKRLSRRDVKQILDRAYPVKPGRYVNPAVARRAAQYLRIVRNGGWIISPMSGGLWRLGLRVVNAAEILELAKTKGFGG